MRILTEKGGFDGEEDARQRHSPRAMALAAAAKFLSGRASRDARTLAHAASPPPPLSCNELLFLQPS
jgi:hypothetical protein